MAGFPLHKGADGFMSLKQFETFYWPSLKKVILGLINEGIMSSLFAEGSYTFALDRYMLFDLDALRYEARLFSILDLSAGRIAMRDFSGMVLADTMDGLRLALNLPWSVISVYAGTSALRFLPTTTIVMSADDAQDVSSDAALQPGDAARQLKLAPPRVVEGVQALFPELFLRQDLTVSLVLQQDLFRMRQQIVSQVCVTV